MMMLRDAIKTRQFSSFVIVSDDDIFGSALDAPRGEIFNLILMTKKFMKFEVILLAERGKFYYLHFPKFDILLSCC